MKDIIKALAAIFAAVPADRIYVHRYRDIVHVEIQAESDIAARSIAEVLEIKLEVRVASSTQWLAGVLYGHELDVSVRGPSHPCPGLDEEKLRAAAAQALEAVA